MALLNCVATHPARDVPGTSTQGPRKVLMSENCLKIVFLGATALALHVYFCFLLEKQIFKMSKWDPAAGHSRDQVMGFFGDLG